MFLSRLFKAGNTNAMMVEKRTVCNLALLVTVVVMVVIVVASPVRGSYRGYDKTLDALLIIGEDLRNEYVEKAVIYDSRLENVTVGSKVLVSNSTGTLVVKGKNVTVDYFRGVVRVEEGNLNITRSSVELFCTDGSIEVAYLNKFESFFAENCTVLAGINEFRNVTFQSFNFYQPLPLMYSYGNRSFWTIVGNYWPDAELSGAVFDEDGDGVSDGRVCVSNISYCENVLLSPIDSFTVHKVEFPGLYVYEYTETGKRLVGKYEPIEIVEPAGEAHPPTWILIVVLVAVICAVVGIWMRKARMGREGMERYVKKIKIKR